MNDKITQIQKTGLSETELKLAESLASKIDVKNETSIMNFGIETQKKLGDSSTKILAQVKTREAEEAGEALSDLVQKIQGCDINQSGFEKFMSKIPLLGMAFNHTRKIISQHQSVESNLDEIVGRLDKSRLALVKDNTHLSSLYEDNVKFIVENKVNIEALKIVMRDISDNQIPEMEKYVLENPNDNIKIQELSTLKNTLGRIDKKVHNLQLFEVASIQSLPRINLIKEGNKELVENIQSTVLNVIPLWRNQIAETIALIKQGKIADMQEAVYDVTNKLIRDNATRSKENTIAIAKQTERGIIDIETLQIANKEFMATIDGVIKVKEDGSKKRRESEVALESIKKELSDKIKSIHITSGVDGDTTNDVEYTEVEDVPLLQSKK